MQTQHVNLTAHNFFHTFILKPDSRKLSTIDRTIATIASVALGFLSLGIIHAVCYISKKITSSPSHKKYLFPIPPKRNLQHPWNGLPIRADKIGLKGNIQEYHHNFLKSSPDDIYQTRDQMMDSVEELITPLSSTTPYPRFDLDDLGKLPAINISELSPLVGNYMKQVSLYHTKKVPVGKNLLGLRDVLEVSAKQEFNEKFKQIYEENAEFRVFHAAAPNIGESANAKDFKEFSSNGKLDVEKYLKELSIIFYNVFEAQSKSSFEVTDSVWIPFGMGAFLRNLWKNDSSYKYKNGMDLQKDWELKQKIAECLIARLKEFPHLTLHLCLPCEKDKKTSLTNNNYNAFVQAVKNADPDVSSRIKLWINCDALSVAQKLADEGKKTGLVNAANRRLLGNHWFKDGALTAIDENLHRRMSSLAVTSLFLNDGTEVRHRNPGELRNRVEHYGGKTVPLA